MELMENPTQGLTPQMNRVFEDLSLLPCEQQDAIASFIKRNILCQEPVVFLNPDIFEELGVNQEAIEEAGRRLGL